MGALPSQKYDTVLQSFVKYLIENYTTVGFQRETVNDMWIKQFLKDCDNKEWEI